MTLTIDRVKIYTLYFLEYLRYAEFKCVINAILYMLTRRSYADGKTVKTRMGIFETRKASLDFQYINYAYEIELKHFIQRQKFDVFFDVGACLGEYCIWLGRKGYRCYAFEPVYESFKMIDRNITLNNLRDNITVFNYGLGQLHSNEHFLLNRTNPGANKRVSTAGNHTEKFEIRALDEVFERMELPPATKILMKIDVEGMEVEMLQGAKKFLNYFPNITLIIEDKITGESNIRNALNMIGTFVYGNIDNNNIYAKKIPMQHSFNI